MSTYFFGILSVFSLILLPLYFAGDPLVAYDYGRIASNHFVMRILTYLNVTGNETVLAFAFIYALVIIPLMGFSFIILYHHKFDNY